ncbi:cell wall-associated NlpC family hydrolase [Actinomycetospora succinea]|uniref:Cell wall-associated NlpC family hydrolase n=1 Tax=Actinomycetospora succinea TaxID=663603 RepID=A0A4R6UWW9_9PSEU|nr:NlpC/P60 family protein [Actinomycetospora succinea]TDQ51842.1 cell wall-associated NlpC family hydrolase [Actinomycetospora succinea]
MRGAVAGPAVVAAVLVTALALVPSALAAPPSPSPTPPPTSQDPTSQEPADEAGSLVARIATAKSALDRLTADLGKRQELANRALADDTDARRRADDARKAAEESRRSADAAAVAAERARADVDAWITAWFQQADVLGPLSVLSGSSGPDDVAARAHLRDVVTADQRAALDGAERARIEAANADSRARAARIVADEAAARAAAARVAADAELARVRTDTDAQQAQLRDLTAQRDAAEARLRDLEDADPALAAQRDRAEAFDAAAQARDTARDARVRRAASAGLQARAARSVPGAVDPRAAADDPLADAGISTDGMSDEVRQVLERALSQLGVVYAWGGGDEKGPTLGIRDGGVADQHGDYDKTGFDCSGLMIYAFAAAGKELPHYSGYQTDAGQHVALEDRQPGDLLFWADDDGQGPVHHVALYLGDDQMVEAPESGKTVRITSVRFDDEIVKTVTRVV